MKSFLRAVCSVAAAAALSLSALAAPITFTPQQQEAANKISAKGGLVMQLANDSDALVVNMSLGGKQITDAEVAELKNLPKIAQLNLANTAVTDSGLANIAGLTELTSLHLERTGVTDAGLPHLKGLAKLEYLNLYGTAVGDAGLANLQGLKNLKRLYLWQTKVTDAGVNDLKKAVAGVTVNRGEELAIVVKTPEATSAAKALNSKCPVTGKDVVAGQTLTHEGKLVGFCCGNCPETFKKEPAKFASKIKFDLPAPAATPEKKPDDKKPEKKDDKKPVAAAPAAGKPVNTKCPVSGKAAEASFTAAHDGKTVGFCCDKCLANFNKDPKKFAGKIVADAK